VPEKAEVLSEAASLREVVYYSTVKNTLEHRLKEVDSRLSAHMSRLENKIDLMFEMLQKITNRIGE
jgi:hypothetical protein